MIGIPERIEKKLEEAFKKIVDSPCDDDLFFEFFHIILVHGIEQIENYGDDELLLSFFLVSDLEENKESKYLRKIKGDAREYIRLTSNFLISGSGENTSISKKKKVLIRVDQRDVNFVSFLIENKDVIRGLREAKSKRKRDNKKMSVFNNPYHGLKTIGLGVESKIKIKPVRSNEVIVDQNTDSKKIKKEKHTLYTAGWSLSQESE